MKDFVNTKAAPDGDGSGEMPFRPINDAAKLAVPGDEIENPDGTSICFDTDYAGKKRTGMIIPSPFAVPKQVVRL